MNSLTSAQKTPRSFAEYPYLVVVTSLQLDPDAPIPEDPCRRHPKHVPIIWASKNYGPFFGTLYNKDHVCFGDPCLWNSSYESLKFVPALVGSIGLKFLRGTDWIHNSSRSGVRTKGSWFRLYNVPLTHDVHPPSLGQRPDLNKPLAFGKTSKTECWNPKTCVVKPLWTSRVI